jgi:hypothetical protein
MRKIAALAAAVVVGAAVSVLAPPLASADYGKGAVFQVEISANNVGGVPGDGAWIWIGLNSDGTGDYTMSDCIHTGSLLGHPGLNTATHSRGDVTWTDDGTNLTITGVGAIGGLVPVTIVVPDIYGHYVLSSDSIIVVPPNPIFEGFHGTAQVQVAP